MCPRTEFTLSDGSPLTPQEQFVLQQAPSGENADLQQEFGGAEEERRLRARFLEELLTGELPGVRMHRRGVWISHAVIEEPLHLENAEVAVDVSLDDCIFKELFSVMDASFNKHLSLISSHFSEQKTNFNGLKVGQNAFFDGAEFHGPVDFGSADIKGQFAANRAKFLAEGQDANFNGMQVGWGAFFDEAEFHGPVDFGGADIKRQFVAKGAKFLAKDQEVYFNGLKVGYGAFFDGAEFHGPVDFGSADIKRQFWSKRAKFLSQDYEANFNGLKVGQSAFFDGAEFHGPVDLRDASCHHLQIAETIWPDPKDGQERVYLEGLTYQGLTIKTEEKSEKSRLKNLIGWLDQSRFNTQNYTQMEAYLQQGGNKELADEVFITGKRRARRRRRCWSPGKWGILFFWDWLAGYGRKPQRILWASLLIIIIGAFTFDPQVQAVNTWLAQLYPQHPWLAHFFLSLDRFLPGIDMWPFQIRNATDISLFTCIWWQFQKVCGLVLIPIALAAIYTRIK